MPDESNDNRNTLRPNRNMRRSFVGALVALVKLIAVEALAQQEPAAVGTRPLIHAVRLQDTDRIVVDGVLDENVWLRVEPATDFLQRDPDNGAPATERTEVRVVFDGNRIIFGVKCFDAEPHRLLGNQMQRDQPFSGDDRFMWALDPYMDGRTGYFFEINPSGAMGDGLITGPVGGDDDLGGQMNKSWDGIWLARVRRSTLGWTAEIEIPFKTLNFDPAAEAWGINFQRTVRRKNEESLWTGWLRNEGLTRMSNAGRLAGVTDITQGIGLDIKPFIVGTLGNEPGRGAPQAVGDADVGVDLFYNVTPALKLNFTVNTDFAETEVDERQTNLTRFPLRFPEKREFFLDGSSFFEFPPWDSEPFFSRRIGLNEGTPQQILFGTKLIGQIGKQDIGLLHVRTGEDEVAPSEDFSVVRVKHRFGTQSHIGMLYTRRAALGLEEPIDDRYTVGTDLTLATPHLFGNKSFDSQMWFLHTSKPDDVAPGSNAYGWSADFPNDPWSGGVEFREFQGAYDAAVGFTPRRNVREWNPEIGYAPRLRNHRFIRGFEFEAGSNLVTDLHNQLITREYDFTPMSVEFHSGDQVEFQIFPTTERLETDFEISDGIVFPMGSEHSWTRYQVSLDTAEHRPLSGRIEYSTGGFWSGERREINMDISVRPRAGLAFELSGEYNDVDLPEGRFTTRLYRFDARTQFNPWISLANNIQYDSESRLVGWQLRFRWILKPGDDVFFVYTQNWLDDSVLGINVMDRRAAMKVLRTWRF
jgi:Domain of unknown function (DUF5916)